MPRRRFSPLRLLRRAEVQLMRAGLTPKRVVFGGGCAIIFGVIVIFLFDAVLSHREGIDKARRDARNAAILLAEHARGTFDIADKVLEAVRDQHDDWVKGDIKSITEAHFALKRLQAGSRTVSGLAWFDATGARIVSSLEPNPPPFSAADRPYFTIHRDRTDDILDVGPPVFARPSQRWIMIVTRGMRDDAGRFLGVAGASMEIDVFRRFMSSIDIGAGRSVALFHDTGFLMSHDPPRPQDMGQLHDGAAFVSRAAPRGPAVAVETEGFLDPVPSIVGYMHVPGLPVVAVVALPRSIALAPWRGRIAITGPVTVLVAILVALTMLLVSRQFALRGNYERQLAAAQRAAVEASRGKSEFLAHMSHELRTPLNAIIGFAEIGQRELFGPLGHSKYKEYIGDIRSSGEHLLQLINEILDLSKVEARKWTLNEERATALEIVGEAAQMLRDRAQTAGVTVDVDAASLGVVLFADRRILRQIVINLAINAIKFSERGGAVRIGGAPAEGGFALRIADDGAGIAPEDIAKVLEPFGQAASGIARKRHDTGLGLPLCKAFAELHGGSLKVESVLKRGTTVTVMLPAARIVPAAGRAATEPAPRSVDAQAAA